MTKTHKLRLPDYIAGNSSIDSTVRRCLDQIGDQSIADRFIRHTRQRVGNSEKLHSYHELLLGTWANSQGARVQYEPQMHGMTPDWHCHSGPQEWILEVANIHNRVEVFEEVETMPVGTWCYSYDDDEYVLGKCDSAIRDKSRKYKPLNKPIVLGLALDFDTCMTVGEARPTIEGHMNHGEYDSSLSAVVLMDSNHVGSPILNPHAKTHIELETCSVFKQGGR